MLCSREKKNLQFKEHPGTSMSQHKSLTEISRSLGCKRKREAGKHRHTFPPLLLLILIYPKCINLLTGKPYKIVTAMKFQRLYGWDVHTPTETIPLRSVKNSIQINLPDVLSHSSGACITKSEDADLTTSQCNHNPKTSAAPPESTYLMPPVISHWQQQVKIKLIPSKNSEMCLTKDNGPQHHWLPPQDMLTSHGAITECSSSHWQKWVNQPCSHSTQELQRQFCVFICI